MKFNTKYFSKALKNARGDTGLRSFARYLGMSPTTLTRLESGNIPDMPTFTKILGRLAWTDTNTFFCEATHDQ